MIGYLYPGQSPQKVGMGRDLYHRFARAREIFNTADAFLGFSLSNLCFKGPADQLNQDLNCQLAVYTHSCAVSAILKDHGLEADVVRSIRDQEILECWNDGIMEDWVFWTSGWKIG